MTRAHYSLLLRYGLVGVCGGAIQTLGLYVWVDILRFEQYYLLGASIGFVIALCVTFTLQKYWTFRDESQERTRRQLVLYAGIALLNLGLTIVFLHMSKVLLEHRGLNFFDAWYLGAQVIIMALLAGASFVANYFVTFKDV